jgi:hypothetical protein
MITIPNEVMMLVNDPKSSKTIATLSKEGRIHTIYMGSMSAFSPDQLTFAHLLMKRTHQNLIEMQRSGGLVSVSVTLGQVSYEIMAKVKEYHTSGPTYDKMIETLTRLGIKEGLDKYGIKVRGVWIIEPVEVWNQGPGPNAGTRIV